MTLDMPLISNVKLRAVPSMREHPIKKFGLGAELKREPPTCGTCDGDWAFSARRHGGKPRSFGAEANDQE